MAEQATEFQHNISLIVDQPLENPWPAKFWRAVKRTGPDGIINPVQGYNEADETVLMYLRHYEDDGKHVYEVPLTRNLTEKEAEKIVIVWNQLYEDGDFLIETSTPYTGKEQEPEKSKPKGTLKNVAERLAKAEHNIWLHEMQETGWRYGLRFSATQKTHPMILPWEQLPETYKNKDNRMRSFLFDSSDK